MVEVSKTHRDLDITTVLGVLGLLVVVQLVVAFGCTMHISSKFPTFGGIGNPTHFHKGVGNLTRSRITSAWSVRRRTKMSIN